MCRGFQAAGQDCKVIMPGVATAGDAPDLLRTRAEDLRNPAWWKALRLDLVLLYAWGDPVHLDVASAIRQAGILLVQNLDSAGIESPYSDPIRWWQALTGMIAGPQPSANRLRLVARACRDLCPAFYERSRLRMMDESDLVAAVSPPATRSVREYAEALGFPQVAKKLITVSHPVSMEMTWAGVPKEKRVLCVGRWRDEDCHQKDPATLLPVLAEFLHANPDWSAEIIGRGASQLHYMRAGKFMTSLGDRITCSEHLDRSALRERYAISRILFCPSRYESFHISSAEALCCGCSVVVANHPLLSSTGWFTTRDSGTLAASRKITDLLAALAIEVTAWESGNRSAQAISGTWSSDLLASSVASHLLKFIQPVSDN